MNGDNKERDILNGVYFGHTNLETNTHTHIYMQRYFEVFFFIIHFKLFLYYSDTSRAFIMIGYIA